MESVDIVVPRLVAPITPVVLVELFLAGFAVITSTVNAFPAACLLSICTALSSPMIGSVAFEAVALFNIHTERSILPLPLLTLLLLRILVGVKPPLLPLLSSLTIVLVHLLSF
jgi:hypothetical protein